MSATAPSIVERARADIRALTPYSHAAWEPSLQRMHANELPWRVAGDASAAGLNRYPEPQPPQLVDGLARLYGVSPGEVLVGRGSDEAIDLLMRVFCRAGQDNVIVCPPTFGMYAVAARIQGAEVRAVPLLVQQGFAIDEAALLARVDDNTKLVCLCSPNNPTANALPPAQLLRIARALAPRALLVVDEAYIDFAPVESLCPRLAGTPNLAILKTLSKAHGLAGARVGALLAAPEIIALARKVIPPYAITELTVEAVTPLLAPAAIEAMRARVAALLAERERLAAALARSPLVSRVWPSDANFLLVDCADCDAVLAHVRRAGLIIRDVRQPALPRSLRISVGTPQQNDRLLESLA
ncbi:MAG TPA: histidinol-phosphate transaminase [Steroidobacteraceae bacterium]|nr:histidinol-phosphate transaminase [Steroidobacteraceae bacterium]